MNIKKQASAPLKPTTKNEAAQLNPNNHTCLNSTLNMFCFPALILIRYFTVEWTAWILTASHLSNAWDVIAGQGNNCVWYFSISIQWNWTLFQHDALDFITKYIGPDSIYGLIFLWSRCIKCEYSDAVPNYAYYVCVSVHKNTHGAKHEQNIISGASNISNSAI